MSELLGRTRSTAHEGKQTLTIATLLLMLAAGFFRVPAVTGQEIFVEGSILNDEVLLTEAENGLFRLYNMEYSSADSIFQVIEGRYPHHPIGPFMRALVLWWRILPELESGAEAADEAFYKAMADVIERSNHMLKRDDENFDAMFFKGAALGFRGRLLSNRREWLSAASDGKKALDYIFEIAAADTANADFQFGAGVYNYFAAVIPQKYPIVKPILYFFPDADREEGLRSLEFTASKGRLIRTEAAYFLSQIYLIYEPDFEESIRYSSWLTQTYPNNAFFQLLEGRVYVRWSQWSRAMNSFKRVLQGHEEGRAGYTDALAAVASYYEGRFHMHGTRYEEAKSAFRSVESLSSGQAQDSFYRVNALLRLGMVHDTCGARDEALAAYDRVLKLDDRGKTHEKAKLFKKEPYTVQ